MIFKGKCRKDGKQLAAYLLSPKNDQVRIWDIQGTVDTRRTPQALREALQDFDEIGKMTNGVKTLFHLALNPNDKDHLTEADWQYALAKAEEALGLEGHPRAVVSHTYKGKEHLHAVYSRVIIEEAKCAELSHSNRKLCQAAREVERDLSLEPTPDRKREKELQNKRKRVDSQIHQCDRAPQTIEERKEIVSTAWRHARTAEEFKELLLEDGFRMAVGNRGIVIIDEALEVHSIARCLKAVKHRDVQQRLSGLEGLPNVAELREAVQDREGIRLEARQHEEERKASRLAEMTKRRSKELKRDAFLRELNMELNLNREFGRGPELEL